MVHPVKVRLNAGVQGQSLPLAARLENTQRVQTAALASDHFQRSTFAQQKSNRLQSTQTLVTFGVLPQTGPNSIQLVGLAADLCKEYKFPGAVVGYTDGQGNMEIVQTGQANLATFRQMQPNHRFFIGSAAKPPVAVLVLKQVAAGRFKLDSPIQTLVSKPVLDAAQVPGDRDITVRQLLNHTSGLKEFVNPAFKKFVTERNGSPMTRLQALAFTQHAVTEPKPAGTFDYCNTNYELLGALLEETTGQTMAQLLNTHIIKPLGLEQTTVSPTLGVGPVAQGRSCIDPNTGEMTDDFHTNKAIPWNQSFVRTPGILLSTAQDVMKLYRALFTPETLLDKAQFETMMNQTVPLDGDRSKTGYGLGIYNYNKGQFYFHAGITPGYESLAVHNPKTNSTLAVLVNGDSKTNPSLMEPVFKLARKHGVSETIFK